MRNLSPQGPPMLVQTLFWCSAELGTPILKEWAALSRACFGMCLCNTRPTENTQEIPVYHFCSHQLRSVDPFHCTQIDTSQRATLPAGWIRLWIVALAYLKKWILQWSTLPESPCQEYVRKVLKDFYYLASSAGVPFWALVVIFFDFATMSVDEEESVGVDLEMCIQESNQNFFDLQLF